MMMILILDDGKNIAAILTIENSEKKNKHTAHID